MKFSQRIGINPPEKLLQVDSIDEELRNSIWNALSVFYWDTFNLNKYEYGTHGSRTDHINSSNLLDLFLSIWLHYFKRPIDTIPDLYYENHRNSGYEVLRSYFFGAEWHEVYDFIEFVAEHGPKMGSSEHATDF